MSARILVVDDLLSNVRLLEARLSAEYYEVRTAQSGADAIALASSWGPDLILLDVMMPGMDGYETCARLKADPLTGHIPVVMVTALGESAERVRGLEAGADDFLTKPVDDQTLLARLRSLVRLKRLLDEWRLRAETTSQLGVRPYSEPAPSVRGSRAMVIVDDPLEAERLGEALEAEGIRCDRAETQAEALSRLSGSPYELVVLDLRLTADDPLRLASRLRADDSSRETPVLLVAESEHSQKIHRGFDLGANDYILRPIDTNEFRVRARNQIRRKLYQDRLRAEFAHTMLLAVTDPLTGLHNQRYLQGHLRSLISGLRGGGGWLAAMMLDLDHFKSINDRYGHGAGDAALRAVAGCLRTHVRLFDTVARYGGEEFVVIMPGATLDDASVAAERLRREIAALRFEPAAGAEHGLTVSIGVAALSGEDAIEEDLAANDLLTQADKALYEAKRQGRNRVVALAAGSARVGAA
ncbi:MAG: PleD family two-component system response regulator [Acetobacteraceae bacterium]